jgi:hypothetical protein
MSKRYEELTGLEYERAVALLQDRYGIPSAPYYIEKSYNRFLAGAIKSPSKGKITRTSEGLVLHHKMENKIIRLSTPAILKKLHDSGEPVPYKYQLPENLVYCDYLEHLILHTLIHREVYEKMMGIGGAIHFIIPELLLGFVYNREEFKIPSWKEDCFNILTKGDVFTIINWSINTLAKGMELQILEKKNIKDITRIDGHAHRVLLSSIVENCKKFVIEARNYGATTISNLDEVEAKVVDFMASHEENSV